MQDTERTATKQDGNEDAAVLKRPYYADNYVIVAGKPGNRHVRLSCCYHKHAKLALRNWPEGDPGPVLYLQVGDNEWTTLEGRSS